MEYYVVDTFTREKFKGNPAGVCIVNEAISDRLMQKIAAENNLPETAFVHKSGEIYQLRWFTPTFEIDLCGHATLAAAYVIFNHVESGLKQIQFETESGVLTVLKKKNLYEMVFPKRTPKKIEPELKPEIERILGVEGVELYADRDLYVVMKDEREIRDYEPDYDGMQKLDQWLGVVITAKGTDSHFVSRYFCPELKAEDPVTGSSHSSLIPLWGERLSKKKMIAKQLSSRGGILYCELKDNVVKISGEAALYMKGSI